MNTLTAIAFTLLGNFAVGSATQAAVPAFELQGTKGTIGVTTTEQAIPGRLELVVSPWGFVGTYYVVSGWNLLRCTGTGCTFWYFAC